MDYIAKPIRPLLVRARVSNHVKFARQRRQLEQLSLQDGLTGIANRRAFDQAYARACANTVRTAVPFGLAIFDVDFFKRYNDHYGHGAGDDALRQVAGVLRASARRPQDLAARYGGEEFALLLPDTRDLAAVAAHIRDALAALDIAHAASAVAPRLTLSGGGVLAGAEQAAAPERLLATCDDALYQAKRAGRNRMVLA